MNFKDFLAAWRAGTLSQDTAWRGYNVPGLVLAVVPNRRVVYMRSALKMLKLTYAGELAIPEFMARYEIPDRAEAERFILSWWVWSRVSAGRRVRGLQKTGYPPTKKPEKPPPA